MHKDGQKLWGDILSSVKSQISLSTFKTWFSGSFVLDFKTSGDKNLLIVGVKNSFLKEQVETRYLPVICEVKNKKGLSDIDVVFVVAQKEQGTPLKNGPLFTGVAQKLVVNGKKSDALNSTHTFGNFIAGFSNNLAYMAASQVATNLGSVYNPLLFYGPTGVGKTHLLQAVGNEVIDKVIDAKVLYVTAERFTNDYIESLQNKTQQSFRQKYRGVGLLLFDDIQFLAGKESTQDEFFHTYDELSLSGRQIVAASDRHPKELGRLKERLVNRFLGGMAADIGYPDLEMKMAILAAKCKEKNIHLNNEVLSYIAGECRGGARELEGVLTATLAQIKLSNGNFALPEIKSLISNNKEVLKRPLSPGVIIKAVCKYYKIEGSVIRGSSRRAPVVCARQTLMYLLRSEIGLSFETIGEMLGGRDHSTVIYGVGKVEKNINNSPTGRDEIFRIQSFINK